MWALTGHCCNHWEKFPHPAGPVLHMLRPGSALLPDFSKGFGEVYFSEVLPGHIKAWKRHTRQVQHFAVPTGLLRIVLYDGRPDSPTEGVVCELALGRPDKLFSPAYSHGLMVRLCRHCGCPGAYLLNVG